ncbi:uncharacterized protein [Haliotis cracherodii]|uniref:uncharacterized protein n=1 Tax=Haliotis cracherodii TaxID=6455 RepID=UPI0039ECB2F0
MSTGNEDIMEIGTFTVPVQTSQDTADVHGSTVMNAESAERDEESTQAKTGDDQELLEVEGSSSGGDGHSSVLSEEQQDTEETREEEIQELDEDETEQEEPGAQTASGIDDETSAAATASIFPTASAPRRSGRDSKKPSWMTSGEYLMSHRVTGSEATMDRRSRAIQELAASGVLKHISESLSQAFISILDGTSK